MFAELVGSVAPRLQKLTKSTGRRAVILLDRMGADGSGVPFTIEPRGHGLLCRLRRAVIAEKHDVAEAVEPEALRGRLQTPLEHVVGDGDRSRETHVAG